VPVYCSRVLRIQNDRTVSPTAYGYGTTLYFTLYGYSGSVDKYDIPVLRMSVSVSSYYYYSKVDADAVKQKDMVNSGVGGTKDRNLRFEVYWYR
jgi:hypothetical protein